MCSWSSKFLVAVSFCSHQNGLNTELISNSVECFYWKYAKPLRQDSECFAFTGEQLLLEATPLTSAGPQRFVAPGSVRHPKSAAMAHPLLTVDTLVGTRTFVAHWICLLFQSKPYTLVTCSNLSLLNPFVRIFWSHRTPREGVWTKIPSMKA